MARRPASAFQLAEFVGFEGLGVLTLVLNAILLAAWERRRDRAGALLLAVSAGFLLLLNGAGWLAAGNVAPPDAAARILAVQGTSRAWRRRPRNPAKTRGSRS